MGQSSKTREIMMDLAGTIQSNVYHTIKYLINQIKPIKNPSLHTLLKRMQALGMQRTRKGPCNFQLGRRSLPASLAPRRYLESSITLVGN